MAPRAVASTARGAFRRGYGPALLSVTLALAACAGSGSSGLGVAEERSHDSAAQGVLGSTPMQHCSTPCNFAARPNICCFANWLQSNFAARPSRRGEASAGTNAEPTWPPREANRRRRSRQRAALGRAGGRAGQRADSVVGGIAAALELLLAEERRFRLRARRRRSGRGVPATRTCALPCTLSCARAHSRPRAPPPPARAASFPPRARAPAPGRTGGARDQRRPRPSSPFRVPVFAACTLNATGQSRVTLSLRKGHLRVVCGRRQEERGA